MAMEDPGYCNLSLAVDCTLSLGSTTVSRGEIPARLSRAGSPDHDLAWSLAVRSDPARARTCDPGRGEHAMSWRDRRDPGVSLEYFPPVSDTEGRVSEGGQRAAWPRSTSSHRAYKDDVRASKAALLSMIKNTQRYSDRASRQPWLSPSAVVSSEDSFARVCAHCGTSKTPLWRNGPGGPKSLCNACGIRFKKAGRRSAASAAAAASEEALSPASAAKRDAPPLWMFAPDAKPRKRSRVPASSLSRSCVTWEPLSRGRVDGRPRPSSDEEEGAVLLMGLSCGLVNA